MPPPTILPTNGRATAKRIRSHEVTEPRAAGPSGRTSRQYFQLISASAGAVFAIRSIIFGRYIVL